MKTTLCEKCGRNVRNTGFKRHYSVCDGTFFLGPHNPNKKKKNGSKMSGTDAQLKISPELRIKRAQKAGRAAAVAWIKKREIRLQTMPFDELSRSDKRKKIFDEQVECCAICGNREWNHKPISLELDHINGVRSDESRNNLRLICPNCHSQTPTYKTHNNKNSGKFTDDELAEAIESEDSLYKVLVKLNMNPHGGNYKRLRRVMKERNIRLDLLF